jgi:cell division protein FtsN
LIADAEGGKSGTTIVACSNVVLIAFLAALLTVTAVSLKAEPASASHGYITNSSTVGNPPVLRWAYLPAGFEDAIQSAVASWDSLGIVNWVRNDTVGKYTLRYTTDSQP